MSPKMRPSQGRRERGLTLVEMLVVIVIIGILIGLLVPAIAAAVAKAREAAVSAEINSMAQALAAFKNQYGDYPPSRLICVESGDYSFQGTGANLSGVAASLAPRSIAAIRKFWPKMTISATPGATFTIAGGFYDFNGDGTNQGSTAYLLSGPECLVFFLGGLPQSINGGWGMTGFSRNPANPMQNSSVTTNRTLPLYEFNNGRLVKMPSSSNSATSPTGFPGYIDSLGSYTDNTSPPFYAYFSAYNGVGYDPGDYDCNEMDDAGAYVIQGAFMTNNAPTSVDYSTGSGSSASTFANLVASPAPNPYTSSAPVPTLGTGHVNTGGKARIYINQNSFQIISPGRDRVYGIGGQYIQNSTAAATPLPFVSGSSGYTADTLQTQEANADVTGTTLSTDIRTREMDNVTNFATGRMQ